MTRADTARQQEHRRLSGDEGVVFAEFALVLPFLLWTVLGIFEFGTAWRNTTIVTAGLRSAVRTEAQGQKSAAVDMYALQSFNTSIAQAKNMTIIRVLIYNATSTASSSAGTNGKPSSSCLGASPGTGCNAYTGAQITAGLSTSQFGTTAGCVGKLDANWCPTVRNSKLTDNGNVGPDVVGIYTQIQYKSMTKVLPTTTTVTDYTTARIEPQT